LKIKIRVVVKNLTINHLTHSKPFNNPISKSKKRRNKKEVLRLLQLLESVFTLSNNRFSKIKNLNTSIYSQ
jgi:ADP-heptose:LPS heptosyltransferase